MKTITTEDSTNVRTISYDPDSQDLIIMFYTGASYLYKEVPSDTVCRLVFAESTGKAFSGLIRKGGYEYTKLPLEEEEL